MTQYRRMFVEGDFEQAEGERNAAQRLITELDIEAAKNGVAVAGEVEISATVAGPFGGPRTMRLEADVVTR